MTTVYLAGPLTGMGRKDAAGWREQVAQELAIVGITAISPMRQKKHLVPDMETALEVVRGILLP